MDHNKALYQIALTHIKGVGITLAKTLIQAVGDEESVFRESKKKLQKIPRISPQIVASIQSSEPLKRAEQELEFIAKNKIRMLFFTEPNYPRRLTHCIDAPILLYAKGNCDFNQEKIVSIVGTRNSTRHGQQFCEQFISELSHKIPNLQIISGLAYGIDICAHRAALQNNVATVAVLAHGLDRIYPYSHRKTAIEMLENGALLTEFPSDTNPDRHNFVRRNRIVAGMADAVVVVESGIKGGSLITAEISNSYFREVFAVPGRTNDPLSVGCNNLIADNKAVLLQNAESFISHMGWKETKKAAPPVQRELFLNLTEDEEKIFNALSSGDGMQVNMLAIELNTPVSELFFTLLELEMKNIVVALPGGMYKLA